MSHQHPSSAGLRKLADFLDECQGGNVEVPVSAELTITRANAGALFERLGLPLPEIPESSESYASIRATADDLFGFQVRLFAWRSDVCEQVIEMRPVKVWRCGGLEAKSEAA